MMEVSISDFLHQTSSSYHEGKEDGNLLAQMMGRQQHLAEVLGIPPGREALQEAAIGMVKEAAEVLDAIVPGFKPWQEPDIVEGDKEAIDVLLYLLEYFNARNFTALDVSDKFNEKVDIVLKRIEDKRK